MENFKFKLKPFSDINHKKQLHFLMRTFTQFRKLLKNLNTFNSNSLILHPGNNIKKNVGWEKSKFCGLIVYCNIQWDIFSIKR